MLDKTINELLKKESITDISFNGTDIYIQDNEIGKYKLNETILETDVLQYIKNLANKNNKEFNVEHPIIDFVYQDYRINANHKSISPYGMTFSLRRGLPNIKIKEETLGPNEMFYLLDVLIKSKCNILISGKTGSGKTELQKYLVKYIKTNEKIIVIEDTLDTQLKKIYKNKDIMSYITNKELETQINFDDLIKSSLRNNPDWILISEVRGSEAYQMIKSALSGHSIITTLHSTDASSNVNRLIHLCKEKYDLDQILLGKMISDIFDIGIHLDYEIKNGINRFIVKIVEYVDYDLKGAKTKTLFERKTIITKKEKQFFYNPYYEYGTISKKLLKKIIDNKMINNKILKFIDGRDLDETLSKTN